MKGAGEVLFSTYTGKQRKVGYEEKRPKKYQKEEMRNEVALRGKGGGKSTASPFPGAPAGLCSSSHGA